MVEGQKSSGRFAIFALSIDINKKFLWFVSYAFALGRLFILLYYLVPLQEKEFLEKEVFSKRKCI